MLEGDRAAKLLRVESNGIPIYVQIRDQVMQLIGSGALQPRQQMPTMRQVAVALRVDLNTVRHAYDELARAGVINVLRARGTFVADKSRSSSVASNTKVVDDLAKRWIDLAAAAGVKPEIVARRVIQMIRSRGEGK